MVWKCGTYHGEEQSGDVGASQVQSPAGDGPLCAHTGTLPIVVELSNYVGRCKMHQSRTHVS